MESTPVIKQAAPEESPKCAVESKEEPLFSLDTTEAALDLVEQFEKDMLDAIRKQTAIANAMHVANIMYRNAIKKGHTQASINSHKMSFDGLMNEFADAQFAVNALSVKFQKSIDDIVADDPAYETDDDIFDREEAAAEEEALRKANDNAQNL